MVDANKAAGVRCIWRRLLDASIRTEVDMKKSVLWMVLAVLGGATWGCASPCVQTPEGMNCQCNGGNCSFDACGSSTSNCRFQCNESAVCTGTCGANCWIQCNGRECRHTAGANARVQCTSGTCNVTAGSNSDVECNGGNCVVTAGGGSRLSCTGGTCNFTCEGPCTAVNSGGSLNLTCRNSTQGITGCE